MHRCPFLSFPPETSISIIICATLVLMRMFATHMLSNDEDDFWIYLTFYICFLKLQFAELFQSPYFYHYELNSFQEHWINICICRYPISKFRIRIGTEKWTRPSLSHGFWLHTSHSQSLISERSKQIFPLKENWIYASDKHYKYVSGQLNNSYVFCKTEFTLIYFENKRYSDSTYQNPRGSV